MSRISTWLSNHSAKCATIALLAIPTALPPFFESGAMDEYRHLAPPPVLPSTWAEFLALPPQADAWVKDHFGFRRELVETNNLLKYTVFNEFPSVQMTAGNNGRIFLTSHASTAPPFSAVVDICDVNQTTLKEFGTYLNALFDGFERMGVAPKLMIVPSAPTVQSTDLPSWLGERCGTEKTPTASLLQSAYIKDSVKSAIYYPLAEMRARRAEDDLFPHNWFHWNGPGVEHIAQSSITALFPSVHSTAPRLATKSSVKLSDVAQLFPGVELTSKVTEPDYAASHIKACYGDSCYPEFKGFNTLLLDSSRFENPAAPDRRLLVLSDSFGRFVAGWYARHYRTVEHVAVNNIKDMKQDHIMALKEFVLREPARTDVLFVFHDGALSGTLRLGLQRFHRNGDGSEKKFHDPMEYNLMAQQLYVAFLGRPGDIGGMQSLQRQLAAAGAPTDLQRLNEEYADNAGVRDLIDSFGKSAESKALYPGDPKTFIGAIYRQMFNRAPDDGGLIYWTEQIDSGKLTRSRALLAIAAASLVEKSQQGSRDGALLRKKVAFGALFTSTLAAAKRQCYAGDAAAQRARARVAAVKTDTDLGQSKLEAAKMSDAACS